MICQGISSGAESVFVLEGHVRTRVGEGSYCWTNECSDKKEKALGGLSVGQIGGTVICPCCRTVWKKKSW